MMRKKLVFKTLAVGVIFLFIGVAVAQSTAVEIPEKVDVAFINDKFEDDCDCKVLSENEIKRVDRIFNSLEITIGFILLKHGNNPVIVDECQDILDVINSDGVLWDIFCDFFGGFVARLWAWWEVVDPHLGFYVHFFVTLLVGYIDAIHWTLCG